MSQEPVFPLVHWNSEPVAGADRRLDLQQQRAPDGEKASADAADAPRPILGNLIELECRVVDHRLDGGDHTVVWVSDSYSAPNRSNTRLRETCGQLANRVRMEDAIRIDRDDDLRGGVLQRIAHGTRLSAVHLIPPGPYVDVCEIPLGLAHPLIAVVDGTVILRDHFKFIVRIVALADALDRLVNRLALVVAGHQHAHRGLIRVVFLGFCAGEREFQNNSHQVLDR